MYVSQVVSYPMNGWKLLLEWDYQGWGGGGACNQSQIERVEYLMRHREAT